MLMRIGETCCALLFSSSVQRVCMPQVVHTERQIFKRITQHTALSQVEEALSRLLDLGQADPNNVPVLLAMATGACVCLYLCHTLH